MSARSGGFIAIQGTANAKTWPVEDNARWIERGAGSKERGVEKVIGMHGTGHKGRLPPVVSSLFSIKSAHCVDAIRGMELGARNKERTARQRSVIRVKGSASRGGGSGVEREHDHEHEHEKEES